MIMQQVNTLPKFLSQDTDVKRNDSSSSQGVSEKDKDFSNLVDQHIKKKESAEKESRRAEDDRNARRREAAKADSISNDNVAENGKSIVNDKQQKQVRSTEEEKNTDKSVNKNSKVDEIETTENSVDNKQESNSTTEQVETTDNDSESTSQSEDVAEVTSENEAMLASEKFISLLYNSDRALTDNKTNNKNDSENTDDAKEEVKAAQQSTVKADALLTTNTKASEQVKSNDPAAVDHKLKVFATEVADSKVNNAVADDASDVELLTSKELLQRYQLQAQLTDKQGSNKGSLSEFKLKEQELNRSTLTGENIIKSVSLPVESTVELAEEGLMPAESEIKKTTVNSSENDKLAELKAKLANDSITSANGVKAEKIAELLNDESSGQSNVINEAAKTEQSQVSQLFNKQANQDIKQEKGQSVAAVIKADEIVKDNKSTNVDSAIKTENEYVKAQSTAEDQQRSTAQLAASVAAGKTHQQNHASQGTSTQSAISSAKLNPEGSIETSDLSNEDMGKVDDLALVESELNLTNKENNASTKPANSQNQADNLTRTFTDINAQAAQVKQANDAYSTYQNSEVLNHNVASDTAQIQKNNVQLHQETIAIFRKDFSNAVKDKVMLMVSQKLQQFDITLDPPEFGNMQIRVNLQGEQAAVNFIVQNQQAKEALEQNMPKLREMLAEQGVDVGDANVEQQNQQNKEQTEQQSSTASSLKNNAEKDSKVHVLSANLFNSSATGVDYYA